MPSFFFHFWVSLPEHSWSSSCVLLTISDPEISRQKSFILILSFVMVQSGFNTSLHQSTMTGTLLVGSMFTERQAGVLPELESFDFDFVIFFASPSPANMAAIARAEINMRRDMVVRGKGVNGGKRVDVHTCLCTHDKCFRKLAR